MPWTRQRYKELIKRGLLRLIYPWIMIEWLPCRVSSHCLLFHFTHRLLIHVDAGSSLHEDSLHQSPESSRAGQTLPPSAIKDSLPGASSGKDFWNQSWQQGHGWWWWWGALLAKPGPASFPPLEQSTAAAATGVRAHKSFPACAAQLLLTAPLIMGPQYIVVFQHLIMGPCFLRLRLVK